VHRSSTKIGKVRHLISIVRCGDRYQIACIVRRWIFWSRIVVLGDVASRCYEQYVISPCEIDFIKQSLTESASTQLALRTRTLAAVGNFFFTCMANSIAAIAFTVVPWPVLSRNFSAMIFATRLTPEMPRPLLPRAPTIPPCVSHGRRHPLDRSFE
jgi:hypothetical protein